MKDALIQLGFTNSIREYELQYPIKGRNFIVYNFNFGNVYIESRNQNNPYQVDSVVFLGPFTDLANLILLVALLK